MYRHAAGRARPALILVAHPAGHVRIPWWPAGVAMVQRLPLWSPRVLAWTCPWRLVLASAFLPLSAAALASLSSLLGNLTLFALVVLFVVLGAWRKVPVWWPSSTAREGFDVAKGLLPTVAMLCAVGVFRASGALYCWTASAGA